MAEAGQVGIVGVGVMGGAIAGRLRLLDEGCGIVLRDMDAAKLKPLVERGARIAGTVSELMSLCDTVILSLNTAAIVEAVVFGPDGLASFASPGKLLIDMSSIDPKATAAMAERLRAQTGTGWVDSPLSGGAPAAAEGRLTLMMGGEAADIERAKAVLRLVAANMTHMGPAGAGQTTKLINHVLCACNFMAVAEATRLALDAGVDAERIPAALAGGRADSRILQEFMGKMARCDLTPTGRIDNMLKDLEAMQAFAMKLRTPMPLTSLIADLHRMMVAAGIGAQDSAAYMKMFDFGRSEPPA